MRKEKILFVVRAVLIVPFAIIFGITFFFAFLLILIPAFLDRPTEHSKSVVDWYEFNVWNAFVAKCRSAKQAIAGKYYSWRYSKVRVKTGPMPEIGHPYRR